MHRRRDLSARLTQPSSCSISMEDIGGQYSRVDMTLIDGDAIIVKKKPMVIDKHIRAQNVLGR